MIWKCTLLIIFIAILSCPLATSQDSLEAKLRSIPEKDTSRLSLLLQLTELQHTPEERLKYADQLLAEARSHRHLRYLHHAYYHEGMAYQLMGDLEVAIYALFKSLNYAELDNYVQGMANVNIGLADVYASLQDHTNAILYYKRALNQLDGLDRNLYFLLHLNIGDEYYQGRMYDSALAYLEVSKGYFHTKKGALMGYHGGCKALNYVGKGRIIEAEQEMAKAIQLLSEQEDMLGSAVLLREMSRAYERKGLLNGARSFSDSSQSMVRRHGLSKVMPNVDVRIARLYAAHLDAMSLPIAAIDTDNIQNNDLFGKIENVESAFELAKKQAQLSLMEEKEQTQRMIIISATVVTIIISLLALIIYRYYRAKARINRMLEEQKLTLESLNRTKDKFFSIISHDLRGPISSFHGISHMIKMFVKADNKEQLLEVADDIDRSAKNLTNLLNNLLSWALQQQGTFPYNPEKLNLSLLIQEIINNLSNMAWGKNIRVLVDIDPHTEVQADRNMCLTVFRNLLNNALKFTPEGGKVHITSQVSAGNVLVTVRDNGVGMDKDQVSNLFQPKATNSSFGTSGEKGIGLGLQLVKEFTTKQGGQVHITSQKGKGTAFSVSLPEAS